MGDINTFGFQKEHRPLGCEDAPPVMDEKYLIVCDGLGGSGSDKISYDNNGKGDIKTSAYLGSRILSSYTRRYFDSVWDDINSNIVIPEKASIDTLRPYVENYLGGLRKAYGPERVRMALAEPLEGGRMLFPSTLASAMLFPHDGKLGVFALWAGDSRVYVFSGRNGLMQLSMDDSAAPYDSLHTSSHMSNCLACQRGRDHYVNYAWYELEEPGMVFASSDGITDYLPSPMTLERVMLLLGVGFDEEEDFPSNFASSVSDILYKRIYDDTTLAGAFWKIGTRTDFERVYSERILEMVPLFEEADEIMHSLDNRSEKLFGIFKRRPQSLEESPRFEEIWKSYVGDYQLFKKIEKGRVRISELK